jgi:hypothetical protein
VTLCSSVGCRDLSVGRGNSSPGRVSARKPRWSLLTARRRRCRQLHLDRVHG